LAEFPAAAKKRISNPVTARGSRRGTAFCGTSQHEYELYLAVEDIATAAPRREARKLR